MTPALTTALSRIASKNISVISAKQASWLRAELAKSRITPNAVTTVGDTWRLAAQDHTGTTLISLTLWRSGMGGSVNVTPPAVHVDYSETQEAPVLTPEVKRSSNLGRAEAARLLAELNAADDIPEAPARKRAPVTYRSIVEQPSRPGTDVRGRGSRLD